MQLKLKPARDRYGRGKEKFRRKYVAEIDDDSELWDHVAEKKQINPQRVQHMIVDVRLYSRKVIIKLTIHQQTSSVSPYLNPKTINWIGKDKQGWKINRHIPEAGCQGIKMSSTWYLVIEEPMGRSPGESTLSRQKLVKQGKATCDIRRDEVSS